MLEVLENGSCLFCSGIRRFYISGSASQHGHFWNSTEKEFRTEQNKDRTTKEQEVFGRSFYAKRRMRKESK